MHVTAQSTAPLPRLTWRGVGLVAGLWLLYSGFFAGYFAATMAIPLPQAFLGQLTGNVAQALYSLPIWLLVVRTMDRVSWGWRMVAHLALCPAYVAVNHYTWMLVAALVANPGVARTDLVQWQLLGLLFTYGVQFGIYHTVRSGHKLRWREQQHTELLTLMREQELSALKAQLHPHFLFNCLNTISATVSADPEEARRQIAQLADILRYSVDTTGQSLVPFAREWQLTRSYLSLEEKRLGDRLRLRLEVDPQADDVPVPPMVLQPLVENAVHHGLADSANGGDLIISVQVIAGSLRMEVRDTGSGAPDLDLESLMARGTGLRNISSRLRVLYGEAGRLEASSPSGGGFRVVVTLPVGVSP